MRRILTILIALFSIITIYAQETDGYKGKVKSVTEKKCNYVDRFGDYIKENCYTEFFYKYDSDGNSIESSYYNSDGTLERKFFHKYDSDGNMIEDVEYKGNILIPVLFTEWIFEYYD